MLFIVTTFLFINAAAKQTAECGYRQCPPPRVGSLNVHLVPHSHMDAGWAKTFDQYYHGSNANVSLANVKLIYYSVLTELLADKGRRFTFSETAYFWRWWKYQTLETRALFKSLVADGRISFAGGGWVQTDESTVDYLQILDQYTWGFRFLNDTLGPCARPRAGWQTDSYGHTREHASLLAQMGFDGLFIGRVGFSEKEAMMDMDRLEFIWRGSDVLGRMSDVMVHALYDARAPAGFCYDWACAAEPVVVDTDTTAFNADQRAKEFIRQVEVLAKLYNHGNVLIPMGGDFSYQNAASWFKNMDNLISYVESHRENMSDVNIFYSSPACYLKSIYLHGRKDRRINVENDEFFGYLAPGGRLTYREASLDIIIMTSDEQIKSDHVPYEMDNETYWTGFYSSRPGLKYLARRAHVYLQVAKQLSVLSNTPDSPELQVLRHAVSLVTHHDGITGTSSHLVNDDFVKTLVLTTEFCSRKISQFLSTLTPTWENRRQPRKNLQFLTCHHLNLSECALMDAEDTLLLLVYNPMSFRTHHHVRMPAISLHYSIRDFNDDDVEYQILPLPESIASLPGRNSTARHEIYFEAENIPPLGFTAYHVTAFRDQMDDSSYVNRKKQKLYGGQEDNPTISNEFLRVTVDQSTGLLESVQHADGIKIMINQNFYYYPQVQQDLQSGSYSFRPGTKRPLAVSESVRYQTIKGQLVKEIRQSFTDWVSQTIRLYRGQEFVELEWVVGPVPLGVDRGKEVVTIFRTNISNDGTFYTDSNSRQMMRRTCQNGTRKGEREKSVSACYYPVTSRICLQSANTSAGLCVLADRTQGGTSYDTGDIELMIHRRLMTSDGIGLDEPLNEEEHGSGAVVRGKHRIFLGNYKQEVSDQSLFERGSLMSRKWTMEPWMFFTSGERMSRRRWRNVRNKRYSGLKVNGLPPHIHVLTLEPWKGDSILLRLENLLEKSRANRKNDKISHSDITVNLREIFLHHRVKTVKETTLAANQWLDEARQMDWSSRYLYDDRSQEEWDYNNDNPFEERRQSEEFTPNTERRRRNKYRRNYPYSYHNRYPRSSDVNKNSEDPEININDDDTSNEGTEAFIDGNYYITLDNISNFNRKDHVVLSKEIEKPNGYKLKTKEVGTHNATNTFESNERKSNENDTYADHDVTESMYEMYYKTRSHLPQSTAEEFKQSDIKRNKEYGNDNNISYVHTDNINYKTKETKSRLNTGQISVDESTDDISDEDNDGSDEGESDELKGRILEKRSLRYKLEHRSEVPEQDDFLFTLRPTQIRTFVVWFEESKYNLPRNK